MRRIRLVVSYDGSGFYGWQKQKAPGQISIAESLENVLSKLLNEPISISASGRTDAGVHALNQVAHFDTRHDETRFKNWDFI